jgi:hypothetical protein
MYNVLMSKRYNVAVLRERLADALDEAERGIPVIIERRGVRYRLAVESPTRPRTRHAPRIEIVDPAIGAGEWTWAWSPGGMKFRAKRRRS